MATLYNGLTFLELKTFLDEKYLTFCQPDFLPEDPLGLVHEFSDQKDQEIIGLLFATIAWGNRKSILKSGRRLIDIMGGEPARYVQDHAETDLENLQFVHRTFQAEDLKFFIRRLKQLYSQEESLESYFSTHPDPNLSGVKGRIVAFREALIGGYEGIRTEKHIANPLKNSASKRINMYLRWMCRPNDAGVDLGIWNSIPLSELCVPLDVHTGNIAREFGLIQRQQNDWKALEELMVNLRKMDPNDPCKYDFSLFGLGAIEPL